MRLILPKKGDGVRINTTISIKSLYMETENFNYQTKCLRYFCVCLATDKLRDQINNSYRFPW